MKLLKLLAVFAVVSYSHPSTSAEGSPAVATFNTLNGQEPIVIGHRGASGSRPEHTLEAYALAIENGADFIEPDLVATKDGVLIARHENVLATVQLDSEGNIVLDDDGNPIVTQETSNIAEYDGDGDGEPDFAGLLTVKEVDGALIGGWFTEDLTLAEIKELNARERIPDVRPDNTDFNDQFEIPTLAEVIQLVKDVEAETGREIGIYPETKHPTYFQFEGQQIDGTPIDTSLGQLLIDTLVAENFTDSGRIFIQSFEFANLIELQNVIMPAAGVDIPLVQLYGDVTDSFINANGGGFSVPYDIPFNFDPANAALGADPSIYDDFPITVDANTTYADLISPEVLNFLGATYAEGAGPWKNNFLLREPIDTPVDGDGDGVAEITSQLTGEVLPFIEDAHNAGLQVHPYTLRNEERFLTLNPDGTPQTPEQEFRQLIELGADGFFTDFPGTGAAVLAELLSDQVIEGTDGDDDLLGGFGDDEINGLDGDDEIDGSQGDDEIDGGDGDDMIMGGDGDDLIDGGDGDDEISGGDGDDEIMGGDGDDLFRPGLGSDIVDGGDGNNSVGYTDLDVGVTVDLGAGMTTIGDGGGVDELMNIQNATGSDSDDTLIGDENDNVLNGGAGNDTLNGGEGNDTADFSHADGPVDIDLKSGEATYEVDGETFTDTLISIEGITGTDSDDDLVGDSGDNKLDGGAGDDNIKGGSGNDELTGGEGDDNLNAGSGNDKLNGSEDDDNLRGGSGDDELNGGDGDDSLNGGSGNDMLNGGAGDDMMRGGSGDDVFIFEQGTGFDTVRDFYPGDDLIDLTDFGLADFDAVVDASAQIDSDVVMTLGAGDQVTLLGVNLSDLESADFILTA